MVPGDDESSSRFRLDLDNEDFKQKALDSIDMINRMGNADSLKGLADQLIATAPLIGAIGIAVFAAKEAFDAVMDAEKIKLVNQQFEVLSRNAGVFSDDLKRGLENASRGWVDETTLMQAAGKALAELQVGADKLPKVMELARKATAVMGGDFIQNFEAMTQAVASGRTMQLRHLGIIIDQTKAIREYAKSIGVTVDSLSLAGKQEAILNALLEQGSKNFKGVTGDVGQATTAWAQFKAMLTEVGESFSLIINKVAGGPIKSAITWFKEAFQDLNIVLKQYTTEGLEKTAARSDYLSARMRVVQQTIQELNASIKRGGDPYEIEKKRKDLELYHHEYIDMLKESSKLQAELKKQETQKKAESGDSEKVKQSRADEEKVRAEKAKTAHEIAVIDAQITQEEIQSMDSIQEATKLYNQKRVQEAAMVQAQIDAIRAKESQGTMTHKAANDEIVRLNKLKDLKMRQDDQELERMQKAALDQYVRNSDNAFQGVGRAFQSMSAKNKMAMHDWGQFGDKTAQTFGTHMTSMFQNIGSGSQDATDAMKSAFAGMIADVATNYGQMMMLASIFPPDPPVFAAGAALVALGGFLGSVSGSSPSSAAGSAATSGDAVSGSGDATANPANPTLSTPTPGNGSTKGGNQVNLIIQGHMITNDQTARWITEQVRAAADQTDFTVQGVGGGF